MILRMRRKKRRTKTRRNKMKIKTRRISQKNNPKRAKRAQQLLKNKKPQINKTRIKSLT
jgi:hypothetical protein